MNGEAGKGSKRRQEDSRKVRENYDGIDWSDGMEREVALDGVLNMAKWFGRMKTTKTTTGHTIEGLAVRVYDEVREAKVTFKRPVKMEFEEGE